MYSYVSEPAWEKFRPLQNHELAEINASLQEIVRRAYDLGRSEALKRVLDVLSTEPPAADQLVLMPPAETMPAPQEHAPNHEQQSAKTPWWAWPVR